MELFIYMHIRKLVILVTNAVGYEVPSFNNTATITTIFIIITATTTLGALVPLPVPSPCYQKYMYIGSNSWNDDQSFPTHLSINGQVMFGYCCCCCSYCSHHTHSRFRQRVDANARVTLFRLVV